MRQSIVDGIEQVYKDATAKGDTNMEVLRARGSENTLADRLDKSDAVQDDNTAQLAQKAEQEDLNATNARVSTLIKVESTTDNAETRDIRVSSDGSVYEAAGDHVRDLGKAVNIKTGTNILKNGGFDVSLAPWSNFYSSYDISNGKIKLTGLGTNAQILLRQPTPGVQANTIRKLYVAFDHFENDNSALNIDVRLYGFTTPGTIVKTEGVVPSTTTSKFSMVMTTAGNGTGNTMIEFIANYSSTTIQSGKTCTIDNVIVLDLTTIFGAGKEPTAKQMEVYLSKHANGFFDGVGVVKSIGDDFIQLKEPKDGTLTVSKLGLYPTLNSALDKAKMIGAKTTILVKPGEYKEVFKPFESNVSNLIFEDKYNTKLIDKSGTYSNSPLFVHGDFYGKNLNVIANSDEVTTPVAPYSYAYHHEGNGNGVVVIEDSKFESELNSAIGIGMRQSQKVIFKNCDILTHSLANAAGYIHNAQTSNVTEQRIEFWNCRFLNDIGQYALRVDDSNIIFGNGDNTSIMSVLFVDCNLYSKTHGTDCVWIHEAPLGAGKLSGNIDLDPMSHGNNITKLNAY